MSSSVNDSADALFSAAIAAQSQKSQLAQYAIQQAAKFMQDKKYDSAIKEFKKAIAFDPQNETAFTNMGNIYLSQGKTGEAIKAYKEVARLQPLSVTALTNLGNAYIQGKQYTESEKVLKAAARMDPLNPLPNYTLGHQYIAQDRLSEAEALFKKVEKVSPKDGNVFYSLGLVANKQGKFDDAVPQLKKALSLKSNFPAANYELGVAYANLGMTDEATEQYNILRTKDISLAKDLKFIIDKPQMSYMDTENSGGFVQLLGAGTPLWMLDPALSTPESSKKFSVTIAFTNAMDVASVMNPQNWTISRAKSAEGGYYNNTMPVNSAREVTIQPRPMSVIYDPTTQEATLTFSISQNAEGNATIDPSHLVFKFSGKDASGRSMDTGADEIDGYAAKAF